MSGPPVWYPGVPNPVQEINELLEEGLSPEAKAALLGALSAIVSVVPVLGTAKDIVGFFTGTDIITGEELDGWDQAFNAVTSLAGVVGGFGKLAGKIGREAANKTVIDVSQEVVDALNDMPHLPEIGHLGYIRADSASAVAHTIERGIDSGSIAVLSSMIEAADSSADAEDVVEAFFNLGMLARQHLDELSSYPDVDDVAPTTPPNDDDTYPLSYPDPISPDVEPVCYPEPPTVPEPGVSYPEPDETVTPAPLTDDSDTDFEPPPRHPGEGG